MSITKSLSKIGKSALKEARNKLDSRQKDNV